MTTSVEQPVDESPRVVDEKPAATRGQIRGSSLLLAGRLISMGVNFGVQVLIVRYLTQASYGAFAYALSVVALIQNFATFGLDRAVTRFVPIYEEEGEYDKLFGTIIMVVSTILFIGLAASLIYLALPGSVKGSLIEDELAHRLLLILIFLAPVQAIDELLVGMFAVFASPRAIFFRKYVLAPALKLAVVALLILGESNVFFLALGYLAAAIVGVAVYAVILFRLMRREGLFEHFQLRSVQIPWREVLAFTIPLLTSDLVYTVMNSMDAIILERSQGVVDVAALRAVQPAARMNQVVLASFGLLFTPLAARMFARKDPEAINSMYWQNAVWIAVASFPVFVVTFSLARPITLLLYGERYADSAVILALLSFGYYFNAALGQNGLTLKVYGKLRYVVGLNVAAAVTNLLLALVLIPRYGALGAAVATASTMLLHNFLKQAGLGLGTGINIFDARYVRVYVIITVAALSILVFQAIVPVPWYVSLFLAGIASLLVFRLNRHLLDVEKTFPELLRIPLMRRLLTD